ncbi:hypothetical protein MYK68_01320 [Gordonia sp. PP30]|uniref:hypothetical protein n=1 Tax=Gordonia sp. PP30 TaxID=2935861 RepID=UPI001FFED9C4|nr:hypothetical protein [Gordonia sp. PP30]UQE75309.1 hypothetical protein MYK68_01320 [Gordonia sp. PP30]
MSSPQSGDGSVGDVPRTLADLARSQPLPPPEIARMLGEVAQALDGAGARGEVYRSVRPENITVDAAGRAALVSPPPDTAEGSLDAVVFASPEQLRGRPLDPRSDQYSLAATAFALLTGTPPYAGSSSTAIVLAHGQDPIPSAAVRNPQLPPAADPVFYRALAKNPAERFPDSRSFTAALRAAIEGVSAAVPGTPAQHPGAPAAPEARRRSKVPLLVGALIAVVLVVVGITAFVLTRSGGGTAGTAAAPSRAVISGDLTTICAAHKDGPLACTDDNDRPVVKESLKSVSSLDTSATPCAVAAGQVYCWGGNSAGQLGTGSTSEAMTDTPQAVPGMNEATVVAGNGGSPCAINAGEVYCWGDLGDWSPALSGLERAKPTKIPGLSGVSDLSASWDTGCALADHAVWCWGRNEQGQAGDARGDSRIQPTKVDGLGNVTRIQTRNGVTCAVSDSEPYCWGNIAGLVGDKLSLTRSYPRPTKIPGFGRITDLAVTTKSVQGDQVPGTTTFETVGSPLLCAITAEGTVKCAGDNSEGQLGTGDTSRSGLPVDVKGVTGATAIAVDSYGSYACAMAEDLMCWGRLPGHYGDPWLPRALDWPR